MARNTGYTEPKPAEMSAAQIKQSIVRINKRIDDLENFNSDELTDDNKNEILKPIKASIDDALVRSFGNNTVEYSRYYSATRFDWPINMFEPTSIQVVRRCVEAARKSNLSLLKQAVVSLEERLIELGETPSPELDNTQKNLSNEIFLVHGHNIASREEIARFLERCGLNPVVLHERPNQGRTIIEKFEANSQVGFAVVLLTPDDIGGKDEHNLSPRARQNVILELGYFIGKLGRSIVCAMKAGGIELPSDILGVVWTPLDTDGWRVALAKELQAAGYNIDWNRVMS